MNNRGLPERLTTGIGIFLLLAVANTAFVRAQAATTDWEKAAGGKMSFEVASVKQGDPGRGYRSNFPLTLGSNFGSVGNLMSVDVPLRTLVGFAYKLSVGQTRFSCRVCRTGLIRSGLTSRRAQRALILQRIGFA
jgi:hypothetical protein